MAPPPPAGLCPAPPLCPCRRSNLRCYSFLLLPLHSVKRSRSQCYCAGDGGAGAEGLSSPASTGTRAHKILVAAPLNDDIGASPSPRPVPAAAFPEYRGEDPFVDKLRSQLGVIHPIPPLLPVNRTVAGFFVLFFFIGVAFDKLWTARRRRGNASAAAASVGPRAQLPAGFSQFLAQELQRKESVEWVNMVLGKLWKVYRSGIENWIVGLLQPVIDDIKKPEYVQRVEIKQFSLGDEPLSVRNVERRTSRRATDLQYQIGLRYTGGAWMALSLSLRFTAIPIVVPVWVRDFDIDGELWVKLGLIPSEPWVGAVSWAFVSLPKIKFELSLFRFFNLMAIPVLSLFLTKLLTEDLPRLFVRPKKIVLDFQQGRALGPVAKDFITDVIQEGNKDYVGELSVTLVDARELKYTLFAKTDPYVIMTLGDQEQKSKKNSQTTVIGPPGAPIWNQDFHLLVANPKKQKLIIQAKDSFALTDVTIGTGEVELGSLQDTVPTDKIVAIYGGWALFGKRKSGEVLLRLTYKRYVEDEEDEDETQYFDSESSEEILDFKQNDASVQHDSAKNEADAFINILAAILVSEEFQGIVASETGMTRPADEAKNGAPSAPTSQDILQNVTDVESESDVSADRVLVWLAVITGIVVLISSNIGGSSNFNP